MSITDSTLTSSGDLSFAGLPSFQDGPRRGVGDTQAAAPAAPSSDRHRGSRRRDFISLVAAGGAFIGLNGLALFRSARRAGAEPPPWTEIRNRANPHTGGACGFYETRNRPCHTNMCVGTSAELMDSSFCTTVCEERNRQNPFQWHKNRTTQTASYRDYPGDICAPTDDPGAYDAWRWNSGNCGSCRPANYRCHDGQKRDAGTDQWYFTICEGLAACNGHPYRC